MSGFPRSGVAGSGGGAPGSLLLHNFLALQNFWAAVANRNSAPVKILCGPADSWTAQQYAGGTWDQGWPGQLRDELLSLFPVVGLPPCGTYIPIWATGGAGNGSPQWTLTGAWATGSQFGPCAAHAQATGAATATITVVGTSMDIWSVQFTGGAAGKFSYSIDGGAPVTVTVPGQLGAHGLDGFITHVPFGSGGQHTVTLAWVQSPLIIDGAYFYNGDENSGFQVYQCGHAGWSTTNWLAIEQPGYFGPEFLAQALQPALIIYMLGRNDYVQGALTSGGFQTNMAQLMENAASVAPGASLLVVSQSAQTAQGFMPLDTWQNFVTAMNSLSRSALNTPPFGAFLDLSPLLPAGTSPNGGSYYVNNHPNLTTQSIIGQTIAELATAGTGDSPPAYLIISGAAQLGADVAIGIALTVIQTSLTLPVGTYLVIWDVLVAPAAATVGTYSVELTLQAGTATCTFTGQVSTAMGSPAAASASLEAQPATIIAQVVVTAPGTIQLVGIQPIAGTAQPYAKAATPHQTYPGATGYQLLRMR